MADQTTSGAGPAAPLQQDAASLQMLVQLLLSERQEAMQDKQEKIRAFQEREKQRRINAEHNLAEKKTSQTMCSHKKNQRGIRGPKVDYAVSFHTFSNAESYIRCLICGMKWKNQDTAEFLIRRGQKVPNHTETSWKDAYKMLQESTNTATSSEVQLNTRPMEFAKPDFEANPRATEI
jgi:hypothetical protein